MTATSPTTMFSVSSIIEAAKSLSRDERVELFDRFTEVLGEEDETADDSPLSPEWMEEIRRRVAGDDAGITESYDLEDVLHEARESLKLPA